MNSDHLPKISDDEFESCMKEMIYDNESPANFLSGWFFNEPVESISRRDVADWLAGTFWNTFFDKTNANESVLISRWIESFEEKVGMKFKNEGNVIPLSKIVLTRDPLTIYHKPLIHYSAVRIANYSAWIILSGMGFQKYQGTNLFSLFKDWHAHFFIEEWRIPNKFHLFSFMVWGLVIY